MAATSRVGAAQDALKAAIAARPGLAGVPVDVGFPAPTPAPEHVWLSGHVNEWTTAPETTAGSAGLGPRDERFTLVVRVYVFRAGPEFLPLRDRALAIRAEVEQAVAADPLLGGAVALAFPAGGRMDEAVRDEGREVGVEVLVSCRAQLAG
jgi:hypothetical protein